MSEVGDALSNMSHGAMLIGALATFTIHYTGIIWKLSAVEWRIKERVALVKSEADVEVQKLRQELLEVRLIISKEYLRKDSFKETMDSVEQRLIRFEGKLDKFIENNKHG